MCRVKEAQNLISAAIDPVIGLLAKDKRRKTIEYLDAKLSTLEKQWVEFHERNESIVQNTEDKSEISYFTDNVYGKTKQLYESTKVNMMDLLIYHRQEEKEKPESSVDFDFSGIWEDEPDDNIKILLNPQKCNFKALERAMTKIKIELISEKWELEAHLSTLKGKWDSIDKLHWKLENAHPNTYNFKKMHDVITESLNGLTNMGVDVRSWGPMIVHNMSQKLDAVTLHEYTRDIRDKSVDFDLSGIWEDEPDDNIKILLNQQKC
ncbi:putative splicing factor, arginine/serine-rich 7, partial [Operophtera brumata]